MHTGRQDKLAYRAGKGSYMRGCIGPQALVRRPLFYSQLSQFWQTGPCCSQRTNRSRRQGCMHQNGTVTGAFLPALARMPSDTVLAKCVGVLLELCLVFYAVRDRTGAGLPSSCPYSQATNPRPLSPTPTRPRCSLLIMYVHTQVRSSSRSRTFPFSRYSPESVVQTSQSFSHNRSC